MSKPRAERMWVPVAAWAALTAVVVTATHLSRRASLGLDRPTGWRWDPWYHLGGLVQYDGHRYLAIAVEGYWYRPGVQSPVAWFPLYPLLIDAVGSFGTPPIVAGVLVTIAAAGIALSLYWHWLGRHASTGGARLAAFGALALYPYAWYLYGTVYADAVFLALAIGSLLSADADRRWSAALLGALATATRPTALALVPVLWAIAATHDGVLIPRTRSEPSDHPGPVRPEHRRPLSALRRWSDKVLTWLACPAFDRTALRSRTFVPLLSLGGIAAYVVFLWWRFGEPFLFLTNQATFHGRFPYLKLSFFSRMWYFAESPLFSSTLLLQVCLAALAVVTCGRVSRRFGFPYALLVLGTVAIPAISTHNFMGTGRYLLLAFPAWAVVGEHLAERPGRARLVLAASALVMIAMSWEFGRSAYLS